MSVLIRWEGVGRCPVSLANVRKRAERMLSALTLGDRELSLLLCSDERMRELNQGYRGIDASTDVLAFAMGEGERLAAATELLGDVVIAIPTATRQAAASGRDLIGEVTFLLAHGLLHLLGFDHRTRAEERRMTARTDVLVAAADPGRRSRSS